MGLYREEATVDIGQQRRTIHIEPIEEPQSAPLEEPSPAIEPAPLNPPAEPEPDPAR